MILLKTILLLIISLISVCQSANRNLITLNEDTWTDILKGEWMVEFYAPWCPACKDLQKAWHAFADWSKDLNINVAEVDVTVNPGLSGRFLVTALPTIYHVKDGVFRAYAGSRDKNDFINYIEEKKWTFYDPIPSYKYPSSPQMTVVAWFFKLSMFVRDRHNYLVDEVGIPSWASYSVFAGLTLTLGCILGFFIVCIIDRVFPTNDQFCKPEIKKSTKKDQKAKAKKDEGKKKDDDQSQDERNSQEEESTDESVRNRKGTKNEVKKKK
ncbi:thioredoxin [Onchocerca flexuosa]|uniref:Thioredoxin-related transmembrane protein 1 n=1 Tax=Onchocerca flexuosa TaxID=387005 RepID=A0A238C5N4_9BILA|nr:thioredoxin [Onchocerca flexuosa]